MKNYKILLIGSPGSGKSTLTRELKKILDIPVLHLDKIWHTTNYDETAKKWFIKEQTKFMDNNTSWVIDGNYNGTLDLRIERANLIIWFHIPRRITMIRVLKRSIKRKFQKVAADDMSAEFKEKLNREYVDFLRFVWDFEKNNVPTMEEKLRQISPDCELIVVKNKGDVLHLLDKFRG